MAHEANLRFVLPDHSLIILYRTKNEVKKHDIVSWSAFHASLQEESVQVHSFITQSLPLFYEKLASAAMSVPQWITEYLNPGQLPVMASDAPFYALVKLIQWNWPDTYRENKFIAMFVGLYIEMTIWKTFGNYLEGFGWTSALTKAEIATSGTADAFLKVSHLTRTRHAHQVTAVALVKLQTEVFLCTKVLHIDDVMLHTVLVM